MPLENIAAIVTTTCAANSHMAIIARALGIPTVVGVAELPVGNLDDAEMIVDAYQARVYVHPSRELRKRYKEIIKEERQLVAGLDAYRDLPAETPDGHRITLYVNTGLMADVARGRERGAEGVGLYRSEIPFMLRDRFPELRSRHGATNVVLLQSQRPRKSSVVKFADYSGQYPL